MKIRLLSGATATGPGTTVNRVDGAKDHGVLVSFPTAPTAITVDLEGSIDGTTWVSLVSHAFSAGELTAKKAYFTALGMPVEFVRANITALTGTVAADVDYCAPTRQ